MSKELRTVWVFLKWTSSASTGIVNTELNTNSNMKTVNISPNMKNSNQQQHLPSSAQSSTVFQVNRNKPLTKSQIIKLSNPPINVITIGNSKKSFTVYDDSCCIGGTKQRLLGRLLFEDGK